MRGEALLDPIVAYKNVSGWKGDPEVMGGCITGGYVYRGKALPALVGSYVYGDWSGAQGTPQGRLFFATPPANGSGAWKQAAIRVNGPGKLYGCVTAFGEDNEGELYVLTNGSTTLTPGRGKIWKMVPEAKAVTKGE